MKIKSVVYGATPRDTMVILEDGSKLEGVTLVRSTAQTNDAVRVSIDVVLTPVNRRELTEADRAIDGMNLD